MNTETVQVEGNITGAEAPIEEGVQSERPEWLPEKFKSPEDMAKAYGELEKEFTKSRQEPEEAEAPTNDVEIEGAKEAVESVGLDFEAMSNEYTEQGGLTEETYKALEDKGIPKNIVDSYIQGQEAIANDLKTGIYSGVGGEESYKEMTGWAAENMSPSEKEAYNTAVNSGNLEQAKLAVDALAMRYKNNVGSEPNLVGGKASASVDVYESWAQVTTDMKSSTYVKDPAFRASVERKLGRSKLT